MDSVLARLQEMDPASGVHIRKGRPDLVEGGEPRFVSPEDSNGVERPAEYRWTAQVGDDGDTGRVGDGDFWEIRRTARCHGGRGGGRGRERTPASRSSATSKVDIVSHPAATTSLESIIRRIEARLILTVLLTTLIAGCDLPGSAPCEATGPNGQVVANTNFGAWPAELSWRELWRAGGLDEAEVLVRPADVAVSPDGSVAVADWGLAEVILFGPDGEWRGAVTTRGEGPGEVQAPVAVTWVDANTLLILDVSAFRMVTLDLASRSASVTPVDPAFLSPVFAAGQVRFVALQPDRTVWLEFPGPIVDGWEDRSFVRWSPDRPVNDTIMWSRARGFAGTTLAAWPRSLLGVGAETWVVSNPDGRYELEVFDRDGTSLVRFCHTADALPLSPAERGEGTDAEMPGGWQDTLRKLGEPPNPAIISRIVVDLDGRIWAQRDRPLPGAFGGHGAPGAMYDVFLQSGRFLGSIRLPDEQRLMEARGRRVWTLHTGALGESSIMALEIGGL